VTSCDALRSEPGTTTRRRFLLGAAAGLAGASLPARLARAVVGQPAVLAPPVLGIQSFTLRRYAQGPLVDVLASLGVRRVELIPELAILFYEFGSHFPVTDDGAEIDRVVGLFAARGISISASGVHSIGDAETARRLFDFALRARIPLLTISPDDDVLDELDRLCRAHPEVEASLEDRAPNFGACVDTGHFIRSGEDPVEALRRLGPRVHGVHLKDFEGAGFFASGCLLGEGKLDLAGCFRALDDIGFGEDKALSLEFERDSDDLLAEVRTCLASAAAARSAAAAVDRT
jgi:sugar phosphate isomerase/epimerase